MSITKDVANVIAQLPTVVEALTGINLKELVSKIPAIKETIKTEDKK